MHFSAKKLFLIGFIVLLLVGIPASVYLVQQNQETRSRAEKSTNLSFFPNSSVSGPITKNVGDDIPLDVMVDPGTNLVTFVRLEIQYDPDKLATATGAFAVNSAVFPTVSAGPVYSPGKIIVTLSSGFDATKAVQTKVRAATIKFKALAPTDPNTPTLVTYSVNTLVTSLGANDQSSENVLSGTTPASIAILGAATSPTPGPSDTPTTVPTNAPTGAPTAVPTDIPTAAPTSATTTPTTAPTGTSGTNPVCSSLTVDKSSGQAPLAINFTAVGTSTSPNTVSKATFNFGDGQVSDVTTGGGIGTASVNAPLAHTYATAGTFQATVVLTDSANGVSNANNCTKTITVSGAAGAATATPTLAATGSTAATIGFAAAAAFFMIGGAMLFFLL